LCPVVQRMHAPRRTREPRRPVKTQTTKGGSAYNGSFLGWRPDARADGRDWRVAPCQWQMYIGDIQERARLLPDAVPGINRTKATSNLQFLAWQQQSRSFSGNH